MKLRLALMTLVAIVALSQATGQTQPATSQKSLAATMNVYVFPTKGQAADLQSQDEAACYTWAVQQVGTDPFELQKQAEQQQQQKKQSEQQIAEAGKGAGAKGAVGGAAAGAIISRRRTRQAQASASAQAEQQYQQAAQATQEQMDNFKKAFSVCLEGKNYLVKY